MKKNFKYLLFILCLFTLIYYFGPKPTTPKYDINLPNVPTASALPKFIDTLELKHQLKSGNQALINWHDSTKKQKTEYVVLYLHGFSASHQEGDPIHINLASQLDANLYLSRLSDHGLDTIAPMQYFTADRLWDSAKLAYAIAKQLGDKVIVVGTSTGGSLALKLAATYPEIHSLILLSPNIEINDSKAWLLNNPWGLQIAQMVSKGNERLIKGKSNEYKKYWYTNYRLESLVQLEEFVETAMTKNVFQEVTQPLLLLYYYKNEEEQDDVVRVSAMLKMFEQINTPDSLKQKIALSNVGHHVIGSYVTSKDLPSVESAITQFLPVIKNYSSSYSDK